MTSEKPDSNTRCIIVNFSWPKDKSVNNGVQNGAYLGTAWELHYPSEGDLVCRLNVLGPASKNFRSISSGPFRSDVSGITVVSPPPQGSVLAP